MKVLRYPVYAAGLAARSTCAATAATTARSSSSTTTVGFVGGYNIGAAYATEWRDTHVPDHRARRVGPEARLRRLLEPQPAPPVPAPASGRCCSRRRRPGSRTIRFHRNVPRLWMFPIRAMYLEAINRASRNIWMTHAYFIPDQDFVDALTDAARRGVDVRLLLPAEVQPRRRRLDLARLLRASCSTPGVRILRFRDAMVHAKTATIDGTWSTVGTANIDRLSLTGNYEINVEIIDPACAAAMEEIFRDRPDQLPRADAARSGRRATSTGASPSCVLNPLRPLL